MRCRAVICAVCCTRLDGINHCHACLKALGSRQAAASGSRWSSRLTAVVVLALGWLLVSGLLWLVQGQLAP
jgi:hypothetical protein